MQRTIRLLIIMLLLSGMPISAQQKSSVVEKLLVRQKTKTLKDGSVYQGDVMFMRPYGKGKCTYVDGTVYQGHFEHGQRHGAGTMTYTNGDLYDGQ